MAIAPVIPGLADPPRVIVPLEPWPTDEIQVPIPATGAIVIERLGVTAAGEHVELELAHRPHSASRDQELIDATGEARFTRVALGQQWRVRLSMRRSVEQTFLGPVRAGQTVTCALAAPYAPHELRFLATDEARRPLRNRAIEITIDFDGGAMVRMQRSDPDGVAAVQIHDALRHRIIERIDLACELTPDGPGGEATVQLHRHVPPGVTALGTVVLAARRAPAAQQR